MSESAEPQKERFEETVRLLSTAVEQATESILITDARRRIQYANPAFERLTGYARNDLIGRTPRILRSNRHEKSFYRAIGQSLAHGVMWHGRIIDRKEDGSLFELEMTISPLRNESGDVTNFVAVGRDVTREVQLELQSRRSQKLKAIGHLAGGVAHDFKNLLQVIRGYTDLALMGLPQDSSVREDLVEVLKTIDRGKDLIRQLLTFSRREDIHGKLINIDALISETVTMLRRVIGANVELVARLDSGFRTVFADPGQIEQILMNLCVNSRDAMPGGGSIVIQTASVRLDRDFVTENPWAKKGDYICLTVADTGSGMSQDTLEHIFEPFFTTKETGKGTGLGLATVYGIVKQHDGIIHAESEPGRGTTFKVFLPSRQPESSPAGESGSTLASQGRCETILVGEDNDAVRSIVCRILENAGYRVLAAGDGERAVQLFDSHADEIRLALLDVVMPRMNGRKVGEHIRAASPHTPLLFCSGYDFDLWDEGLAAGEGIKTISKPYDPHELLTKVREVLDSVPCSEPPADPLSKRS